MIDLKYREINRQIAREKKTKCIICGETAKCCLEFHHLKDKQYNISQAIKYLPTNLFIKELKKCICLCSNCHKKLHAGIL